MSNAVDSGRQRSLLQNAQTIVSELRALPLDPATSRSSYPRMFELVRLVKRYSEATSALPADETRAMWEQRGQWLQEEVAGLAQERIYSPDQQQYWLNLILLLFAGAETCDRVLREKLELELALQAHARQAGELQEQLWVARQQAEEAAQRATVPQALSDELVGLRSTVTVLRSELDKMRGEMGAAQQNMQLLVGERDALQQQTAELRTRLTEEQRTAASRMEVIQQLMERTEASSSQGQSAAAELSRLQTHCRTLSVNLETNAKVIEKLVELNSELMDSLNNATATAEIRSKQHQQQQPQQHMVDGAPGGSGGMEPAAQGLGVPRGTAEGGGGLAVGPIAWTNGVVMLGGAGGGGGSGGGVGSPGGMVAMPRVASRSGGLGSSSGPASTSGRGGSTSGGEPATLTEAFAAFLRDEAPTKPATAAVLAMPPPGNGSAASSGGHHGGAKSGGSGGGGRGMGFGLMSVVRYVAGSDRSGSGSQGGAPGAGATGVGNYGSGMGGTDMTGALAAQR